MNNSVQIQEMNQYFKRFISKNQNSFFLSEDVHRKNVEKIQKLSDVHFESNWNYLMALVQSIENTYSLTEMRCQNNYCSFEFANNYRIQDKGMTKIEAIYNCCFRTLNELWNEEPSLNLKSYIEPFDEDDLS
ncbi:MAG TPA: hypothetical protein VFP20_09630 [Bacteroidales bacterium]|nr:hypothetical protein [Bacteroidales bacterium]